MERRGGAALAVSCALLLACGGIDDDGSPPLARNPNALPDVGPAPSSAPPLPGAPPQIPPPEQSPATPGTSAGQPPPSTLPATPPPPVVVPAPRPFPSLPPTSNPPPPPRPEPTPPSQPPPPPPPFAQPVTIPPPAGPLPPPLSPAEFSGFCEPPSCILHGIAPHPGGGFAVFREVRLTTPPAVRGEGLNELIDRDGSVRRIARGVVVLRGEFDSGGNLHALVEPQWDSAADALDTRVTDSTAIAEFAPSGEVSWVEQLDRE